MRFVEDNVALGLTTLCFSYLLSAYISLRTAEGHTDHRIVSRSALATVSYLHRQRSQHEAQLQACAGRFLAYHHLLLFPVLRGAPFQWRTQEFFSGGGVQQIQLRTEDRENGDLGAVAPSQRFWKQV